MFPKFDLFEAFNILFHKMTMTYSAINPYYRNNTIPAVWTTLVLLKPKQKASHVVHVPTRNTNVYPLF